MLFGRGSSVLWELIVPYLYSEPEKGNYVRRASLTPGAGGAHESPMIRELPDARPLPAVVSCGRGRQLGLARKSRRSFGRLRMQTSLCSQS